MRTIKTKIMVTIIRKVSENDKIVICVVKNAFGNEVQVTYTKKEFELIEVLNTIEKQLKLYPSTMQELWKKIEAYGEEKYEAGQENKTA